MAETHDFAKIIQVIETNKRNPELILKLLATYKTFIASKEDPLIHYGMRLNKAMLGSSPKPKDYDGYAVLSLIWITHELGSYEKELKTLLKHTGLAATGGRGLRHDLLAKSVDSSITAPAGTMDNLAQNVRYLLGTKYLKAVNTVEAKDGTKGIIDRVIRTAASLFALNTNEFFAIANLSKFNLDMYTNMSDAFLYTLRAGGEDTDLHRLNDNPSANAAIINNDVFKNIFLDKFPEQKDMLLKFALTNASIARKLVASAKGIAGMEKDVQHNEAEKILNSALNIDKMNQPYLKRLFTGTTVGIKNVEQPTAGITKNSLIETAKDLLPAIDDPFVQEHFSFSMGKDASATEMFSSMDSSTKNVIKKFVEDKEISAEDAGLDDLNANINKDPMLKRIYNKVKTSIGALKTRFVAMLKKIGVKPKTIAILVVLLIAAVAIVIYIRKKKQSSSSTESTTVDELCEAGTLTNVKTTGQTVFTLGISEFLMATSKIGNEGFTVASIFFVFGLINIMRSLGVQKQ